MPINFDLEELRKKHDCHYYFETGLFDPRLDDISSKQALKANFDKVFCIEIRQDWVYLGNIVFKNEIKENKYFLFHDDSTKMKDYIDDDVLDKRSMFFLDAHVDNINIHNYQKKCPLFDELNAIKSLKRKDHIILIDDLRIIKCHFPWGETSYGDIDFLQQIKNLILEINPDYKFDTLDGYVPDDVLIAYI
jgi:hypothetical protein